MKERFIINVLLISITLFLITNFVVGYNTNLGPSVMGHSSSEVSGTIAGGGYKSSGTQSPYCVSWGSAEAVNPESKNDCYINCLLGSTNRPTGVVGDKTYQFCIKD
ncbi:MAG: hypothetical protein KKD48_04295 [Nanoarchaeota archaeon]|nr:hypothetical protein [Nanoarchaeota archaeon]